METYEKVNPTTLKHIQIYETLVTQKELLEQIKFLTEEKIMRGREIEQMTNEIKQIDEKINAMQSAITLLKV